MSDSPDDPSADPGALSRVYLRLAPELDAMRTWHEPEADCQDCAMLPAKLGTSSHPWAFVSDARCCTYHPDLPNYLVGRALSRPGPGAELIRARLRDPSGVSAWGIRPSDHYRERRAGSEVRFGQDVAMRCPYWVGGDLACGIWSARNAVCRTWFCRHRDGLYGAVRWTGARRLLAHIELRVGDFLADALARPGAGADASAWEAYYRRCAARVDTFTDAEYATIADGDLSARRQRVTGDLQHFDGGLPAVVVPVVRDFAVVEGRLWVHGYSRYHLVSLPLHCIFFFAELTGQCDWPTALERARRRLDADPDAESRGGMTEELVRDLYRIDVLQPPSRVIDDAVDKGLDLPPRDPDAPIPEVLVPAFGRPIAAGQQVWLQGAVPLGSVVAPVSIFPFLARLDGTARWREASAEGGDAISAELIERLFRIGALQPRKTTAVTDGLSKI